MARDFFTHSPLPFLKILQELRPSTDNARKKINPIGHLEQASHHKGAQNAGFPSKLRAEAKGKQDKSEPPVESSGCKFNSSQG